MLITGRGRAVLTIPLRHALVSGGGLPFPEGTATAAVLQVGADATRGLRSLSLGGLAGALAKLAESGLHLWPATLEGAVRCSGRASLPWMNRSDSAVGASARRCWRLRWGVYMPFALSIPIALGGVADLRRRAAAGGEGLLLAAGLITGRPWRESRWPRSSYWAGGMIGRRPDGCLEAVSWAEFCSFSC